ncbi:DUF5684 domain-containing protein [Chloroflexota bacterium]
MENEAALALGTYWIIYMGILVLMLVSMWKIFTKAGKPGWGAIIPIYNGVLLCNIGGKLGWWALFYFIPLLNVIISIIVSIGIAENFGKGAGFGLGLVFLSGIFYPILAFGSADYASNFQNLDLEVQELTREVNTPPVANTQIHDSPPPIQRAYSGSSAPPQKSEYSLTLRVTGEGTLIPTEGTYQFEGGTVAFVNANPSEGW